MKWASQITLLLLSSAAFLLLNWPAVRGHLTYPPGMDQDLYLASGRDLSEGFGFQPRAPLYGAWVGLHDLAVGRDLERTFYAEKATNALLMIFLTSLVFGLVTDTRTALLAGFWTANCKYLLFEPNGSNAFGASMVLAGLAVAVAAPPRWRAPVSLLLFYAGALARPELLYLGVLAAALWALAGAWRGGPDRYAGDPRVWAGVVLLAGVASGVMWARPGKTGSNDPYGTAFHQGFAVTYVHRNHLERVYPHEWSQFREVYARAVPGANGSLRDTLRKHPREVLAHVAYNARVSLKAVPAMALGVERPAAVGLAVLAWAVSYLMAPAPGVGAGPGRFPVRLTGPQARAAGAWALAALGVIPFVLLTAVQARHYTILIPVQIAAALAAVRAGGSWLSRGQSRAAPGPASAA